MNYFYDYFAKEYRQRPEVRLWGSPAAVFGNIKQEQVKSCRELLRNAFNGYREGRNSAVVKRLLGEYREYISSLADETAKDRYNAFVYRYMSGTYVGSRAIAGKLGVSKETVWNYINRCFDDMLILCMGIGAINEPAAGKRESIRIIISNNILLSNMAEDYILDIFARRQDMAAVEESRKHTKKVINQLTMAAEAYMDYCRDKHICIDTDIRKAEVLEKCLAGYSAGAVARDYGISEATVYADIRENEQRLAAMLFSLEGGATDGKGIRKG